jgi:hypothetical protein
MKQDFAHDSGNRSNFGDCVDSRRKQPRCDPLLGLTRQIGCKLRSNRDFGPQGGWEHKQAASSTGRLRAVVPRLIVHWCDQLQRVTVYAKENNMVRQ